MTAEIYTSTALLLCGVGLAVVAFRAAVRQEGWEEFLEPAVLWVILSLTWPVGVPVAGAWALGWWVGRRREK